MKRKSVSYAKWGYIFLAPFFIVYIIFSLYPLVQTFYNSFLSYVVDRGSIFQSTKIEFGGLSNYASCFSKDETLFQSFLNTIIMWILGFIPQIAVSLLLATWFTDLRLKIKAQGFFKTVIYLPNVIMASAVAFMFQSMLARTGALYGLFHAANDTTILNTVWGTRGTVAFINFLLWYGNTTILLMAAIMGIDPGLYEAAQIDGATPSQTFWKITMPLIRPILSFVLVTSMIGGLQMYDVPALLTKDTGNPIGKAYTLIMEIQQRKDSDVGKASAVCVLIFIISAILGLFTMFFLDDTREKKKKRRKA
jgi:multiple sugar transport system permease protein